MISLIFIVEDDLDFLKSIQMILEEEGYSILTARNGKDALEKLKDIDELPDLIISDVKMPVMDGYELFKNVSDNARLNQIPFIFLTGLNSEKDIRFGKILGVDDYLVKPVKEKDLIASVRGKLIRNRKSREVMNYVNEILFDGSTLKTKIEKSELEQIWMVIFNWNDRVGPELNIFYPKGDEQFNKRIEQIGNQCFYALKVIYGDQKNIENEEYLLITLENVNKRAFLYFDAYANPRARSGETKFMISIIAPEITYLDSIQIKNFFKIIAKKIKKNEDWDIKLYWEKISDILTSSH